MKIVGKLSPEEADEIIQSFGSSIDTKDKVLISKHNLKMQMIAERFNINWEEMEIDPEGNVICKDCDSTIPESDVSIEE